LTGHVYRSPVKHSVTIAGHETAITLEPIFWTALRDAAEAQSLPLNALIARIDVERVATADPSNPAPNLASAIRQWLMVAAQSLPESDADGKT
jgi:predicted DNA-binding ribbon-helix-helix protein